METLIVGSWVEWYTKTDGNYNRAARTFHFQGRVLACHFSQEHKRFFMLVQPKKMKQEGQDDWKPVTSDKRANFARLHTVEGAQVTIPDPPPMPDIDEDKRDDPGY